MNKNDESNQSDCHNNDVSDSNDTDLIDKPSFKDIKVNDIIKLDDNNKPLPKQKRVDSPRKIYINKEFYKQFNISQVKHKHNPSTEISDLVEVSFKNQRRLLFKNRNKLSLLSYQFVVVEIENGRDIGTVTACGKSAIDKLKYSYNDKQPLFSILRHAKPEDMRKHRINLDSVKDVLSKTKELVLKFKIDMKITDAEWQFDRQRLTIFFTAPERIDFRELVKELAYTFRTRLELRQINSRDEAKRIGGMGSCGRILCCSSFADNHCYITLDHARTQQLSNNVSKLSGYCGRLKCCLLFEYNLYVETFKKYPPMDSILDFPEGKAKILKADIFKELVYTYIPESSTYKTITFNEMIELCKNGKVLPPKESNDNSKEIDNIAKNRDNDFIEYEN